MDRSGWTPASGGGSVCPLESYPTRAGAIGGVEAVKRAAAEADVPS